MSAIEAGQNRRATAAVVGAGPAGLAAAERLAAAGCAVTVFERMPSAARKFLLAGRGGLNLAHSEPTDAALARYGDAAPALDRALRAYPAEALTRWCERLGIETFVGTSGRIFPTTMKTSPLLRAWLRAMDQAGVAIAFRRRWTGWDKDGALAFDTPEGLVTLRPDVTVLALGGASWPRLGADGTWVPTLEAVGVGVAQLRPANCGFAAAWSPHMARHAGMPLKRASLTHRGCVVRGEAMITRDGVEGGLIYAAAAGLRDAIDREGLARPTLDLRPDLTEAALAARLGEGRGSRSLSTHLAKAAGLAPVAVALMREVSHGAVARRA